MHTPKPVITTPTALADLLNDIVAVLEQEQQALKNSATEQVETVTTRKQEVLQKFNHVHPELVHRVTDNSSRSENELVEIVQIRRLIALCQRYNRENAALVAHGLQMCRHSINFLHSTLQLQSVERYNLDGQTTSGLSGRVIGTA